jgi:nitrate reductase molybdenum cofactor assembly chaperone NarJ/NarW
MTTPWRLLSLLLDYPDDALLACGDELRAAADALPASPAREAVRAELARRAAIEPAAIQREYVATFDFAKRSTLYLSFHEYGDRRQRGMAMLELKRSFRAAGLELIANALPDHLPAVLEFAHVHPEEGAEVLQGFRPALEVVRAALHDEGSPYAPLLDAVCSLLPTATSESLEDARRIAAEGPPDEQVGLEPFAPPESMPAPIAGATR